MTHHVAKILAKGSAMLRLEILSANLAIGTASAFVLATAAASLAVDRESVAGARAGGAWSLRGSLASASPSMSLLARDARVAPLRPKRVLAGL